MMRAFSTSLILLALTGCRGPQPDDAGPPPELTPDISLQSIIEAVTEDTDGFRGLKFRDIVFASSRKNVLPLEPDDPAGTAILDGIEQALEESISRFNDSDSPTNQESRINEVSSHFEGQIRESIDAMPELACDFPRNQKGGIQRTGYPDLRIVHEPTGRVAYLDPKLVAEGSMDSTFRTFYFTPKGETGKISDDAHHLLVGIEHDGVTGGWKFVSWTLVDLYGLEVRLKAEFQTGNKSLYAPEGVIRTSQ